MNELRKQLGIDEYLELLKEDKNCNGAYISFAQYIDILEKENKDLKEKLEQKNKVIEEAVSYTKRYSNKGYNFGLDLSGIEIEHLLDILNKGVDE